MVDPVSIPREDFARIEEKTRTWTRTDWNQMRQLLSYRSRIKTSVGRMLEDLKTGQMYEVFKIVDDLHNGNNY